MAISRSKNVKRESSPDICYEFTQDQTMLPFGLSCFKSSIEAEDAGIVYMRTEGTPASLVPIHRIKKTVKTKNLAFVPMPSRSPREVQVHDDQEKFYFKGVTSKQITDAPSIGMDAPRKKKKSVIVATTSPVVSTGNPTNLFDEE